MPALRLIRGRLTPVLAAILMACQEVGPDLGPSGPSLARGGGSGVNPTVTAVDPTSAPPDTTVNVRILGTGYDRGSKAELELNGAAVPQIKTNSTKYVSSTELVANITIALDATLASYDVAVTTAGGRKGIGTEMFVVKQQGNTDLDSHANWTFYRTLSDATTATRLYGDGRGLDGGTSTMAGAAAYPGETCGVRGKLFNTTSFSNSGDAVFDPAFDPNNTACGNRRLTVSFADWAGGSEISITAFTNALNVWHDAALATVGGSKVQRMGFNVSGATMPCGSNSPVLRYLPEYGSGVQVTRLANQGAARAWEVQSTGAHTAGCWETVKGKRVLVSTHYLPFHAMIVEVPAPPGGW